MSEPGLVESWDTQLPLCRVLNTCTGFSRLSTPGEVPGAPGLQDTVSVCPARLCQGTLGLSGALLQLRAADWGLEGPGGLEKTTLSPVLYLPPRAPFWGRKLLAWGDLGKGVLEGLGEPCGSSGPVALPGVSSMYLMSAARGKEREEVMRDLLFKPGSSAKLREELVSVPPAVNFGSPSAGLGVQHYPLRADSSQIPRSSDPSPVLAGSQGRLPGHVWLLRPPSSASASQDLPRPAARGGCSLQQLLCLYLTQEKNTWLLPPG